MNPSNKKRVLVVDDSALMRQLLSQILSNSSDLEVVGTARDPYDAWQKMHELKPDVLTLDVEMPRMNGIEFLRKIMIAQPTPVVMVSTRTETDCEITLKALELGAVDYVTKPKLDVQSGTLSLASEIVDRVRTASHANVHANDSKPLAANRKLPRLRHNAHSIIAIGASTGGTEAITKIVSRLSSESPGVLIVQHMPAEFTRRFAERLDNVCEAEIREAKPHDFVRDGTVLIAPGGRHMEARRGERGYYVHLHDRPAVNRFRPSVDVLLNSCAQHIGASTLGIILTGMGQDGALGLKALRDAGADTIAQDKATSVVFGMPKAAIDAGAACWTTDLDSIACLVGQCCSKDTLKTAEV